MKKGNVLPVLLGLASIALAVASFLLLPDTVVTQLSIGNSNATTMPKLFAVALPTLLGVGGAAFSLFFDDENKKKKSLLISAVGVVVFAIMLFVNL